MFQDVESGIESYAWSIGSNPRFTDVMDYTLTDGKCAETLNAVSLDLQEGHAYFVNVKVLSNQPFRLLVYRYLLTLT